MEGSFSRLVEIEIARVFESSLIDIESRVLNDWRGQCRLSKDYYESRIVQYMRNTLAVIATNPERPSVWFLLPEERKL